MHSFYVKANMLADFQICISVPSSALIIFQNYQSIDS